MKRSLAERQNTANVYLLDRRKSPWQEIEIHRHPIYGNQLWIDGDLQISEADFAYNSALIAPLLTLARCENIAILGGGDGGVLNHLLNTWDHLRKPLQRVTLIDIDDTVIELCRKWMTLQCGEAFDDARAEIVVGDAFAWIGAARNLDAVIYDLTMDPVREGISRREFIQEILASIHQALRPGGILSLQACGEQEPGSRILLAEIRTELESRFRNVQLQTVIVPSYGERWNFFAAQKSG